MPSLLVTDRCLCMTAAGVITGDIRVSGFPKEQKTFARVMGYCEQVLSKLLNSHELFASICRCECVSQGMVYRLAQQPYLVLFSLISLTTKPA